MIRKVLGIVKREMESLGVDYHYMYNTKANVTYPYVTGEYSEMDYVSENRMSTGDLLLECWNRGSDSDLLAVIEAIKNRFDAFQTVKDGVGVTLNFSSSVPRRTQDIKLKKYEIHIEVVYWKE